MKAAPLKQCLELMSQRKCILLIKVISYPPLLKYSHNEDNSERFYIKIFMKFVTRRSERFQVRALRKSDYSVHLHINKCGDFFKPSLDPVSLLFSLNNYYIDSILLSEINTLRLSESVDLKYKVKLFFFTLPGTFQSTKKNANG